MLWKTQASLLWSKKTKHSGSLGTIVTNSKQSIPTDASIFSLKHPRKHHQITQMEVSQREKTNIVYVESEKKNWYRWSWRRQWHPTPVLLPGKSHRQRSLVGCSPWGRWGSDTTERLHFRFSLSCIGEGNDNPLQCSCLENLRDGGAWRAAVYGVTQSRRRLKWLSIDDLIYKSRNRDTDMENKRLDTKG